MKKQLFNALLFCLMAVPFMGAQAQSVLDEGQSTEGKDFWVTFLQADQGNSNNGFKLSVSISSRSDCKVFLENTYSGYKDTFDITANEQKLIKLYSGSSNVSSARLDMKTSKIVCYAGSSEQVDTCALHITATADISLFATNYKIATFDATNVLPTASLRDEYYIQTYSPSDHDDNADATQGSHFAIVATKDGTVVDYCPTVATERIRAAQDAYAFSGGVGMTPEELALANWQPGDTLHTPELKKGQVYYVWTGSGAATDWKAGDLSGTYVKARDTAKIAVFQGCPHTNIPYHQKERDHIFSQAMPVQYWGNTFVLTQSMGRKRDIFRIMALNDETEVRINGNLVHTFDFANGDEDDKKHFFEFEIGDATIPGSRGGKENVLRVDGPVCYVQTSCPCSVHEFMVSRGYDQGTKEGHNGDPAMLWVNPIEQQIDQITFSTYASDNKGKSDSANHYVNIITEYKEGMLLDNKDISAEFSAVPGSNYFYARHTLDKTSTDSTKAGYDGHSYTLKNTNGSFIAHVYGFTANESYGYSAGGATKPLTQYITISNGDTTYIFSPDQENNLCGKDTIHFACKPDFEFEKIVWHFGDGTPDVTVYDTITDVPHYYTGSQDYNATCSIYRSSSNLCKGQSAVNTIPITVRVGHYEFKIYDPDIPCPVNGVQGPGKIPYTSTINLKGNNVTVDFDAAAKAAGFTKNDLTITPNYFELNLAGTNAEPGVVYGITIEIDSDCGDTIATLPFELPIGNDVITQRYNNVLGLLKDSRFDGKTLSDFQWYRTSDSTAIEGQISSNLNMYDLPEEMYSKDEFYVCYTINKGKSDEHRTCACAKGFDTSKKEHEFEANPDSLIVTANYDIKEDKIFVNANWGGKKDIECYAQWITASGNIYGDLKFDIPDGGCTIPTPNDNGLYLLRVYTDGKSRSFKFIINK